VESIPALRTIGVARFFTDDTWFHSARQDAGGFNVVPMIVGTLLTMFGAVLIATPVGVCSALFCHFYAPPVVAGGYRRIIELLAGIPSVVYGFWGLVVLVPIIREIAPPGPSLCAAICILAIMVLPTIALMSDAAIMQVPRDALHNAAALGLSRVATIRAVVIPSARSGLLTGVVLETGRAIGETMAVLMVAGNVVRLPSSLFDPIRTLTSNIALELGYALGDHRSALFVSGLMLIVLIIALVSVAEWISKGRVYG
ncbi:MAG: phosphate ABC transporter permease subunit PstC, partial [Phycisphaerales bacterium]|nr:phosphate ABC transporter permease subunit PstC [Phycisphaerales bacterium]